jgi:membrane-associated phospholipid phosphatase
MAFAAAVAIWPYRRRLGSFLVTGAVFVGFGCLYVGVHWLSDVLVGGVIGVGAAAVVWLLLRYPRAGVAMLAIDSKLRHLRLRPRQAD